MIRILSELLWALRRAGLEIAPSQAVDAARAVSLLGFDDRTRLRDGLAAVLVRRRADLPVFGATFDAFFSARGLPAGDLFARLERRGFTHAELGALRELLAAVAERSGTGPEAISLRALSGTPADLEHLLAAAGVRRVRAGLTSRGQLGYATQRAVDVLGLHRAGDAIARVRDALVEALGVARGEALAVAMQEELRELRGRIRARLEVELDRLEVPTDPERAAVDAPFEELAPGEAADVRRALRRLTERLRGKARVRQKRARRGRIDPRRTQRLAFATGGVPIRPARRRRPRDRPRIIIVCDVSESVRAASRFLLELVAAVADLFADARSFVFVSELAETTALFRGEPPARALARIASGAVVPVSSNSNYGRALTALEERLRGRLDRRTTIVILGDGRTNHHPDAAEVIVRLRERARAVVWLCPEPRSRWGTSDSAMPRYAAAATEVLSARTARELEEAARRLVRGL